jgi:polyisoprenoid-binding protein YceI
MLHIFVSIILLLQTNTLLVADKSKSLVHYYMKNSLHDWEGETKNIDCQINWDKTNQKITEVTVETLVEGFSSNRKKRDENAFKILEVSIYPKIFFKSSKISNFRNMLLVEGVIKFHGVEKNISFYGEKVIETHKLMVRGRFSVKPSDFKVLPPNLLGVKAEDNIDIYFETHFLI